MSRTQISRAAAAFALHHRANAIEDRIREDRVQAHSKKLPTEAELAAADFAARQLRAAADDLTSGAEASA